MYLFDQDIVGPDRIAIITLKKGKPCKKLFVEGRTKNQEVFA